jgi:tetratricopeptide (TPR) repeat protein
MPQIKKASRKPRNGAPAQRSSLSPDPSPQTSPVGTVDLPYKRWMLKESLSIEISAAVDERGWKQTEAAKFFEVSQSRVSDLLQTKYDKFSLDTLIEWLHRLGKEVTIQVSNPSSQAEEYERSHTTELCEQGVAFYTKVIRLNPADAHTYSRRGHLFDRLRRFDEAIADYTKSLELNPDCASTLWGRAIAYCDAGQYRAAILDCDKMIALEPSDHYAYAQRAQAWERLNKHDSALGDYSKAIALKPDDPGYYSGRALIYEELGQYKNALSDCEKVTKLDPSMDWAHEKCVSLKQKCVH